MTIKTRLAKLEVNAPDQSEPLVMRICIVSKFGDDMVSDTYSGMIIRLPSGPNVELIREPDETEDEFTERLERELQKVPA